MKDLIERRTRRPVVSEDDVQDARDEVRRLTERPEATLVTADGRYARKAKDIGRLAFLE